MATRQAPQALPRRFDESLRRFGTAELRRAHVTTLQINVGKLCNQACLHCHVDAGPKRTEIMSAEVAERLIALMDSSPHLEVVDLTGGSPELNPSFRPLVQAARDRGLHVIDRCNLTVLAGPGQEDLGEFLASHQVEVIASLPCYGEKNVDAQRGKGVFGLSVEGLHRLNALGYGKPGSGLLLNLVYNPGGASLPPDQARLQASYERELHEHFGIVFNALFTITNMPISRFRHTLERTGQLDAYMDLLANSFNPCTVAELMCRSLISIGWRGELYDCDFNQMLDLPTPADELGDAVGKTADMAAGMLPSIWDVDSLDALSGTRIATDDHCFGCTAGAGSSCGGALADG